MAASPPFLLAPATIRQSWGLNYAYLQKVERTRVLKLGNHPSAPGSGPGLADVGVLHGDGDGPRTSPRCLVGVRKNHQMTNLTMPNNISSLK